MGVDPPSLSHLGQAHISRPSPCKNWKSRSVGSSGSLRTQRFPSRRSSGRLAGMAGGGDGHLAVDKLARPRSPGPTGSRSPWPGGLAAYHSRLLAHRDLPQRPEPKVDAAVAIDRAFHLEPERLEHHAHPPRRPPRHPRRQGSSSPTRSNARPPTSTSADQFGLEDPEDASGRPLVPAATGGRDPVHRAGRHLWRSVRSRGGRSTSRRSDEKVDPKPHLQEIRDPQGPDRRASRKEMDKAKSSPRPRSCWPRSRRPRTSWPAPSGRQGRRR